jgi:hypothetical protein
MPAAIAIPLITGAVGAGATVAGAKMASNASKNALKAQTGATNRALAQQERIYNQTRQDQAPFRDISAGAARTLGNLTGIPMGNSQPMGGGLSSLGAMPQAQPQAMGAVMMRAPNGMTQRVPREQVAHYQQRGAEVIQ